jgi:hypothetical protein
VSGMYVPTVVVGGRMLVSCLLPAGVVKIATEMPPSRRTAAASVAALRAFLLARRRRRVILAVRDPYADRLLDLLAWVARSQRAALSFVVSIGFSFH